MKKQYIIPVQRIAELDMQGLLMKLSGNDISHGSGNGNAPGEGDNQKGFGDGGNGTGDDGNYVKAEIWDW